MKGTDQSTELWRHPLCGNVFALSKNCEDLRLSPFLAKQTK